MSTSLGRLLIGSLVLMVLLAIGTFVILHLSKAQKRYQARIASVVGAHARVAAATTSRRPPPEAFEAMKPALRWMARRFGFDTGRLSEYPVKWWIVLPVALLIAQLLTGVMRSIIGSIAIPVLPLGWLGLCRMFFGWCHSRRSTKLYIQFPDALAMIVRGVRVGIPVTEAIRTVAREAMEPTSIEFQKLADQLSIGVALPDALRELSERNDLPEYRFFATALALQSQTGGGLSETLDNLAEVIRRRVGLRARAIALASEARTSIYILASLPVFAGLALAALNPDYMATLFNTESGKKVFAAALTSLGVGIGVMQGIVKKTLQ